MSTTTSDFGSELRRTPSAAARQQRRGAREPGGSQRPLGGGPSPLQRISMSAASQLRGPNSPAGRAASVERDRRRNASDARERTTPAPVRHQDSSVVTSTWADVSGRAPASVESDASSSDDAAFRTRRERAPGVERRHTRSRPANRPRMYTKGDTDSESDASLSSEWSATASDSTMVSTSSIHSRGDQIGARSELVRRYRPTRDNQSTRTGRARRHTNEHLRDATEATDMHKSRWVAGGVDDDDRSHEHRLWRQRSRGHRHSRRRARRSDTHGHRGTPSARYESAVVNASKGDVRSARVAHARQQLVQRHDDEDAAREDSDHGHGTDTTTSTDTWGDRLADGEGRSCGRRSRNRSGGRWHERGNVRSTSPNFGDRSKTTDSSIVTWTHDGIIVEGDCYRRQGKCEAEQQLRSSSMRQRKEALRHTEVDEWLLECAMDAMLREVQQQHLSKAFGVWRQMTTWAIVRARQRRRRRRRRQRRDLQAGSAQHTSTVPEGVPHLEESLGVESPPDQTRTPAQASTCTGATSFAGMKLWSLIQRAVAAGVSEADLNAAEDEADHKAAVIRLLLRAANAGTDTLYGELSGLRLHVLLARAMLAGVCEGELDSAEDAEDPKAAIIELLLRRAVASFVEQAQRLELSQLKLRELIERADAAGVSEEHLDAAEDTGNHKVAVCELIVQACADGAPTRTGCNMSKHIKRALERALELCDGQAMKTSPQMKVATAERVDELLDILENKPDAITRLEAMGLETLALVMARCNQIICTKPSKATKAGIATCVDIVEQLEVVLQSTTCTRRRIRHYDVDPESEPEVEPEETSSIVHGGVKWFGTKLRRDASVATDTEREPVPEGKLGQMSSVTHTGVKQFGETLDTSVAMLNSENLSEAEQQLWPEPEPEPEPGSAELVRGCNSLLA